jgi:hypothetical protein
MHQDLAGALSVEEIVEALGLDTIVNRHWHIAAVSAVRFFFLVFFPVAPPTLFFVGAPQGCKSSLASYDVAAVGCEMV